MYRLTLRKLLIALKFALQFSIKVGGWGQQWTNFPLILSFLFWKKCRLIPLKLPKNHLKQTYFLGGTLLRYYLGQEGILSFEALLRSHFVTVRWRISYRIRFITYSTFLVILSARMKRTQDTEFGKYVVNTFYEAIFLYSYPEFPKEIMRNTVMDLAVLDIFISCIMSSFITLLDFSVNLKKKLLNKFQIYFKTFIHVEIGKNQERQLMKTKNQGIFSCDYPQSHHLWMNLSNWHQWPALQSVASWLAMMLVSVSVNGLFSLRELPSLIFANIF